MHFHRQPPPGETSSPCCSSWMSLDMLAKCSTFVAAFWDRAPPSPTPTPSPISTSGGSHGFSSLTPIPALSPRFVTRTILAVQPRSPRPDRPVTLIATVKLTDGPRDVPTGSVTFLDDTTKLSTVPLSHGKARLVTSELEPGRNMIQVQYDSGPGRPRADDHHRDRPAATLEEQGRLLPGDFAVHSTLSHLKSTDEDRNRDAARTEPVHVSSGK